MVARGWILDGAADVVNRRTLRPRLRDSILRDAVHAFYNPARRLPPEFLEGHPQIDWTAIAAAGNIYRHEYETVDETLVWHTACEGLGELRGAVAVELERLGMA